MGYTIQNPTFNFPAPCCNMIPKRESNVLGAGKRRTALNSGRASCSWCHRCLVHAFLRRAPARAGSVMSMWVRVGEGSKPFTHSTTSPTNRPPVYVASSSVCGRRGEVQEVDAGVGGRVREAAMLR